ncbi:MAG: hypothetical protein PHV06_02805 [bacterium]|nr:hypothetical protein [bacterium]
MKRLEIFYFFLSLTLLILFSLQTFSFSQKSPNFELWFEYNVKGNYGDLPDQPEYLEKGYWWWKEGTMGYWENSLSLTGNGIESYKNFYIKYMFELGTVSDKDRREFEVWSDDYSPTLKMKQANVEIQYDIASHCLRRNVIFIKGGKTLLSFPLFFENRVYAGIAGYQRGYSLGKNDINYLDFYLNWYQIMAYEGKYIEADINYNDDIDLQGGELCIEYMQCKYYCPPEAEVIIPEQHTEVFTSLSSIYFFKLTDAGSGRLGSDVDIFGFNSVFRLHEGSEINFAYCLQEGDYYGYALKDYLFRYGFILAKPITDKNRFKITAEFLGHGSKKDYAENYSFFNLLEEPTLDNFIFKPNPAMIDRLSFGLIYGRIFDRIIYKMDFALLYLLYHFEHADYNTAEEYDFTIKTWITNDLQLDFAIGISSHDGFYKGVFLTYKTSLL